MKLRLPSLFSDHLVLHRAACVPVWGHAAPGEEIAVTIAGETRHTTTHRDGTWKVDFDLRRAEAGPFEMTVTAGKSGRAVIRDVVIGEVWLASGQSNMEWEVERSLGAEEEIAGAGGFAIREFHVDQTSCASPQDDVPGRWSVASPETAPKFSAVAFHFAKMLERELKVPVGIVHSSWGGSRLEAWLAPDILNAAETKRAEEEHRRVADAAAARRDYVAKYRAWEAQHGRQDPGTQHPQQFVAPEVDDSGWKTVTLPGKLAEQGLPDAGVTWLRRKVTITPAFAKRGMHLHIDTFREFERLYIDGELVRETTCESPQQTLNGSRNFHMAVPLRAGEGTWAIRLFSPAGGAEISGGSFKIEGEIGVDGEWRARNESELPPISEEAKAALPLPPPGPPGLQGIPGALYNGMIAPLTPFALAGVIWYQGESNTSETDMLLYADGFRRMIEDWRRRFGRADLPFYYCQLPNLGEKKNGFPRSRWAEFREVQALSATLPHTAMAVLMNTGDSLDIHPRNKRDPGERLARLALARSYGRAVAADAPEFDRMKIEGPRVRLFFRHAPGGLVAAELPKEHVLRYMPDFTPTTAPLTPPLAGTTVHGFAICGGDGVWHWAQAELDGPSVVAWSSAVDKPVAVRYAWADNPTCNLFSREGLPLAPFRTDDFPLG
jgi:sialate O-acetylesterase